MPLGTTSRLASKALAALLIGALSVFPIACAGTESTLMRTPTPDNPWPDSTRAYVRECVERGVSDLPEGQSALHFDLFVTPDGNVQRVRIKGAPLASRDVQECINQALSAMRVPSFVLERAVSNKQPASIESRAVMGDVTVATGATVEEVLAVLEPMVVEAGPVGVAVIVGIFIVAAVKWGANKKTKRCQKQWTDAIVQCVKWIALPNPPRNFTGGHTDPEKCAMGWVDFDCGGTRPSDSNGARPGRRN